jgi:peptidoglycan/xylan/chitin deacetylase (PgdA/CDA1 family)
MKALFGFIMLFFLKFTWCWPKNKLFVLTYHRVLNKPDVMVPDALITYDFDWQMKLLSRYFNIFPLADALEKLKNSTLPIKSVCITFDDGYADNYLNALPVLLNYKLPATFFLTSAFLEGGLMWNDRINESVRIIQDNELNLMQFGLDCYDISSLHKKAICSQSIISKIKYFPTDKKEQCIRFIESLAGTLPVDIMMSSSQLIGLFQSGMEIGGHSVTHPILANLSDAEALAEINENKAALEKILNTTLRFFSYPNGKLGYDYFLKHMEMVKACGYQAAFSTRWAVASKDCDNWQLPRCTPSETTPFRFMLRMLCMYNKGK